MMGELNWAQRALLALARVAPVAPGRPGDGLAALAGSGTGQDKPWEELRQEFADARDAWRRNPLARRLIGVTTAYVVGDGITLASDVPELARFLAAFWGHEKNQMALRQAELCSELARAGELFLTLHFNPADGMSYVRPVPACAIDRVTWAAGDYETELSCHEVVGPDDPDYDRGGRTWLSPEHEDADAPGADGRYAPVMLHYAVNRPPGCVRGESDLAPVLPWLRRYSRWLEDRTRLNAAVHAFLWLVKVPARQVAAKAAQYRTPPAPGSVLVADRDNEEWSAVAPALHANDAGADGRAIRWMIVAGGPGLALTDLGEAETANLATAAAMADQRTRFMAARQAAFGHVLAGVALAAYNRAVRLGRIAGREQPLSAIRVLLPDISPADNAALARAAAGLAEALAKVGAGELRGARWRRLALRLVLKAAGETVDGTEIDAIVRESA